MTRHTWFLDEVGEGREGKGGGGAGLMQEW